MPDSLPSGSRGGPTAQPDVPSAEAIISGVARSLDRFQETASSSRERETTRLVWYAGIAGYVVVNATPYWKALLGREPTGGDVLWLSVPWVVSAVLALLAHLATSERIDNEHKQFYAQRAALDGLLVAERDPRQAMTKVEAVLDATGDLAKYRKATERWDLLARWLQRAALLSLLAAFSWTLIGPSWLR